MSFILWIVGPSPLPPPHPKAFVQRLTHHPGGIITFAGLSVYLEFGLAIPRSGGEKNYLERVYRHPRYLATCVLASQMILLGFSTGNALAFGRYILYAAGNREGDGYAARGIGVACATFAVGLHAVLPKWGMRLVNVLGVFKVVILLFIVFSGFAALAGRKRVPDTGNFDGAFDLSEADRWGGGGVYQYASALLRVIYSYKGWENANYVLSEVKSPKRTLGLAAPIAIGGVTTLYVLANVAYFAAIPKDQLANSDVIVAGVFFTNVFGDSAGARVLPVFVCLSNLGNVLAVSFAHARLNQEMAKEGMLPFSRFWASNKPFNTPAASVSLGASRTPLRLVNVFLALPPLVRHHCHPRRPAARGPGLRLHRRPVHLPGRHHQRLRRGGAHIPALQEVRAVVLPLAHLPANCSALPPQQRVPHCRALHPAGW